MMNKEKKDMLVRIGAIVVALVLMVSVSVASRKTVLRASEDGAPEVIVEAEPEVPAYEPPVEVTEPVVEEPAIETTEIVVEGVAPVEEVPAEEKQTEEIPEQPEQPEQKEEEASEKPEEVKEEQNVSEDDGFDVVEAYERYMALDDEGKRLFLESLSEENRALLLEYIRVIAEIEGTSAEVPTEEPIEQPIEQEPEEIVKEKVKPTVSISFEDLNGGKIVANDTIRIHAIVDNPDGASIKYNWQFNDGNGWTDAGGNAETFDYVINDSNYTYKWRAVIDWSFD